MKQFFIKFIPNADKKANNNSKSDILTKTRRISKKLNKNKKNWSRLFKISVLQFINYKQFVFFINIKKNQTKNESWIFIASGHFKYFYLLFYKIFRFNLNIFYNNNFWQLFQNKFYIYPKKVLCMNKQLRQAIAHYNNKLQASSDDLSLLLDLIYKFPQQQRQQFYDRIQVLRQSISQLKKYVQDCQSSASLPSIEKKYQQIFIKITELKSQITSLQFTIPGRKKKSNTVDLSVIFSDHGSKQIKGGLKSQYQSIMQTIVTKDQQVKKYKSQLQQYKATLKYLEEQVSIERKQRSIVRKQQTQLQNLNKVNENTMMKMQYKIEDLSNHNEYLQNELQKVIKANNLAENELLNVNKILEQTSSNIKSSKMEAERSMFQLAAYQQKYKYEIKGYMQRQQMYRLKQRQLQKKLKDLQTEIEIKSDVDQKNKQLILQNIRLKQDIKVLETELTLKQQHIYDKNKRIQTVKLELSEKQDILQQACIDIKNKQHRIRELLFVEKESQNILTILQTKIKQLQKKTAQQEEKLLLTQKKCSTLQMELKQKLYEISLKSEQVQKLSISLQISERNLYTFHQQKLHYQKELQKVKLQSGKSNKKIEEITKIVTKIEQQKNQYKEKVDSMQSLVKQKQQKQKKYEKEIDNLKRRLLRAKIQTIHNVREVIV